MGWKTVEDPGSGRTYYYNTETKATTWEKPADMEDDVTSHLFTAHLDKNSGKTYYVDTVTNITTWALPAGAKLKGAAPAAAEAEYVPDDDENPDYVEEEDDPLKIVHTKRVLKLMKNCSFPDIEKGDEWADHNQGLQTVLIPDIKKMKTKFKVFKTRNGRKQARVMEIYVEDDDLEEPQKGNPNKVFLRSLAGKTVKKSFLMLEVKDLRKDPISDLNVDLIFGAPENVKMMDKVNWKDQKPYDLTLEPETALDGSPLTAEEARALFIKNVNLARLLARLRVAYARKQHESEMYEKHHLLHWNVALPLGKKQLLALSLLWQTTTQIVALKDKAGKVRLSMRQDEMLGVEYKSLKELFPTKSHVSDLRGVKPLILLTSCPQIKSGKCTLMFEHAKDRDEFVQEACELLGNSFTVKDRSGRFKRATSA